jgi:hypothetical protein
VERREERDEGSGRREERRAVERMRRSDERSRREELRVSGKKSQSEREDRL